MRILAIDTSCGAASVAVVESGQAEPLAVMTKPWRAATPTRSRRWSKR